MPLLQVRDITMAYEQVGQGPDLVCVSGLGCDHTMWDLQALGADFRITVFDNRGVGHSSISDGPWSMELFARDTLSLCEALGIEHAHFAGHSMGGHIVQHIAAMDPDRVGKLVIACSEPFFSVISDLATRQQLALTQYAIPRRLWVANYLPTLFSDCFLADQQRVDAYIDAVLNAPNPQPLKGYRQQVEALRGHDTRALLAKIQAPTLVIGCDQDLLTPLKHSRYLAENIPGAQLQVISDCGHAPFIEQPELFYHLIRTFLCADR